MCQHAARHHAQIVLPADTAPVPSWRVARPPPGSPRSQAWDLAQALMRQLQTSTKQMAALRQKALPAAVTGTGTSTPLTGGSWRRRLLRHRILCRVLLLLLLLPMPSRRPQL